MEALKSDVAVNEAVDVLAAARAMVAECELALEDGEVTPDEARSILNRARIALKEALESVQASEAAYHADRAIDAIRRGDNAYSPYRAEIVAQVGLVPIDMAMPDNVRQFPQSETGPVAS